jgi:hypothetical protein
MKTKILFFLLGVQPFLWANPIDITPITRFSELVFDDDNHWTMELLIPYNFEDNFPDSIILKISNNETKLKSTLFNETQIYLITTDSLATPLTINRDGDQIELDTFSSVYGNQIRVDWITFGNVIGASLGQPKSGFSIMRNVLKAAHSNYTTIDCLTQKASLGVVNDTSGIAGTLMGNMYDMNTKPVTKLIDFSYFELDTWISIKPNGFYSTRIFRHFPVDTIKSLVVRESDFNSYIRYQEIEPIILNNIHPDTTVIQDIHLKSNEYIDTAVDTYHQPKNEPLEVINYPNPFNASTHFLIKIPNEMMGKTGRINIFNVKGERIKSIPFKTGLSVSWDGKDENDRIMPSGKFYYHVAIGDKTMQTGSMILLK